MKKIIYPCDVPQGYAGRKYPMFCKIKIEGGDLSISGVIGPLKSGNAIGGCGQIDMEFDHLDKNQNDPRYSSPMKLSQIRLRDGWNRKNWYEFLNVWKKWHLNNMRTECIHQELKGITYNSDPENICHECGYKIGSAWTKRELPQEVIDFLTALPETTRKPNWV